MMGLLWNKEKVDRVDISKPGAKLSVCPFSIFDPVMTQVGNYPEKYPQGAVVHFTAGRAEDEDDAKSVINLGKENKHCYFVISPSGKIYQPFKSLQRWGYHAGKSSWPELGEFVHSKLVGIEVLSAGSLNKGSDGIYRSWFKERYPQEEVRNIAESYDNISKGAYHKFTDNQEKSLFRLLFWLKYNNPDVFKFDFVLGHDEVSPGRKTDPGGSLSVSMPNLRRALKAEWQEELSALK